MSLHVKCICCTFVGNNVLVWASGFILSLSLGGEATALSLAVVPTFDPVGCNLHEFF